jgi:RHS repeat-associated protein
MIPPLPRLSPIKIAKDGPADLQAVGELRWISGTLATDYRPSAPLRVYFTGQRSEEATLGSLYDYNARFYSPVLGRFLSPDTIVPSPGDPQSLNRYAYVLNNPLRYTDPTGMWIHGKK